MDLFEYLEDLEKDAKEAMEWFAAEYKYLNKLMNDLWEISSDKEISEEKKDYRKARRILKYINRCELKGEEATEKVEKELKKYPQLANLGQQIEMSSRTLLKSFSLYAGDFKKELVRLLIDIRKKEKYEKAGEIEKAKQAEIALKKVVEEIGSQIRNLINWTYRLEASLKQLGKKLQKVGSGEEVSVFKFTDLQGNAFIVRKPHRTTGILEYTPKGAALYGLLKGIAYKVANILFPENSIKLIKIKANGILLFKYHELTYNPREHFSKAIEIRKKFEDAGIYPGSAFDFYINNQGKVVFYDLNIIDVEKLSRYIKQAKISYFARSQLQKLIEEHSTIQRRRKEEGEEPKAII
jgi:hypothetical protein